MNILRFLFGGCFLFFAVQVQAQIGRKPITPDLNGQQATPNFQKTVTPGSNPTAPLQKMQPIAQLSLHRNQSSSNKTPIKKKSSSTNQKKETF
jgi:hypothetical protein